MKKELRKTERFNEIGKVECSELSALPGILEDISLSGCKVRFPVNLNISGENEYKMLFMLTDTRFSHMELICHPRWIMKERTKTTVGFKILRSPDTPVLNSLIEILKDKIKNSSDITSLIITPQLEFI